MVVIPVVFLGDAGRCAVVDAALPGSGLPPRAAVPSGSPPPVAAVPPVVGAAPAVPVPGAAGRVAPAFGLWGVDHHRTPVAVRERLAVARERAAALGAALTAIPGCSEAVVLSTCNRLEVCLAGDVERAAVAAAVAAFQGLDAAAVARESYFHAGPAAVRHLFRVVAGMESLVVGEDQIVRQVKDAYEDARAAGLAAAGLNPLFQRALAVGKEVRSTTAIGKHKLSVASVAVDLARHIHGDLSAARLLVLGAGEIAELAVRYLVGHGVRQLGIVNRSRERAEALAKGIGGDDPAAPAVQVRFFEWGELSGALAAHDIVVASTAASHAVVSAADVRAARRRARAPLLFIDLAVPRDIDPDVAGLADVYLYNIDHLEQVVAANHRLRGDELAAAAAVVEAQVTAFLDEARPGRNALLAAVAGRFQDLVAAEDARLAARLAHLSLGNDERAELRYALDRLANKMQHQAMAFLRAHPDDPRAAELVRELLGL